MERHQKENQKDSKRGFKFYPEGALLGAGTYLAAGALLSRDTVTTMVCFGLSALCLVGSNKIDKYNGNKR